MKIFSRFSPEVTSLLQNGAVGVIPTDTVYGVVGKLGDEDTITRIYAVKGHDANRAVGTILFHDSSQIQAIIEGEIPDLARHWPRLASIILPVGNSLHYAHRGLCSLAFRQPNVPELLSLVSVTGPLATSSANLSGQPVATTVQEAIDYFGNSLDFYVDGGDLSGHQASQIIRFHGQEVEIIRKGDSS